MGLEMAWTGPRSRVNVAFSDGSSHLLRFAGAAFSGEEWASDGSGTVAGGIASANPPHAEEILRMLGASGGSAVAVEEAAILGSQRRLAELEGIYAEPTSAAAFAGLMELVDSGIIQKTDRVLVPVTGFGLKDAPPA